MSFDSPFHVTIDFSTSHTIFPTIIAVILGILFISILITRGRTMLATVTNGAWWPAGIDHKRFFGTLVLTVIYFMAMPSVGDIFPNTGLGFYLCSIPYLFALSTLFLHERSRRTLTIAAANAIIAPSVVWYILSELFNISLP
ncbi:tripartite tricarboxylate transporter TctB family protein [Thalassospira lucentensis]|uniref:tripartite tricarboxylate transporter TctB family protein n=1 Tax=Thalassospira lucentensis TaxID=168935 RepID=UPI003D2F4471